MIFKILALACMTHIWVVSEPTILLRRWFGLKEENYDNFGRFLRFFHKLLNCHMCSGFWISMLVTNSIEISSIAAVASEVLYKLLKKI